MQPSAGHRRELSALPLPYALLDAITSTLPPAARADHWCLPAVTPITVGEALEKQSVAAEDLVEKKINSPEEVSAWLWAGCVAAAPLVQEGRPLSAAVQRLRSIAAVAKALDFRVRLPLSAVAAKEGPACHFLGNGNCLYGTRSGPDLWIEPFAGHLPVLVADFVAPTSLSSLAISWDAVERDRVRTNETTKHALGLMGKSTSLQQLTLSGAGSGQAHVSAPRVLHCIWQNDRNFLASLTELEIDGSVQEKAAAGMLPFLEILPYRLIYLRRLRLGTLLLTSPADRERFFAALPKLARQLDHLILTNADDWVVDEATAHALAEHAKPVACLDLLTFGPPSAGFWATRAGQLHQQKRQLGCKRLTGPCCHVQAI